MYIITYPGEGNSRHAGHIAAPLAILQRIRRCIYCKILVSNTNLFVKQGRHLNEFLVVAEETSYDGSMQRRHISNSLENSLYVLYDFNKDLCCMESKETMKSECFPHQVAPIIMSASPMGTYLHQSSEVEPCIPDQTFYADMYRKWLHLIWPQTMRSLTTGWTIWKALVFPKSSFVGKRSTGSDSRLPT